MKSCTHSPPTPAGAERWLTGHDDAPRAERLVPASCLAGPEVAEPEIFALLPVARLCLGDEFLQFSTRLVTDTEQFINGLWGKPLPIEVRQIENEVSKKQVR